MSDPTEAELTERMDLMVAALDEQNRLKAKELDLRERDIDARERDAEARLRLAEQLAQHNDVLGGILGEISSVGDNTAADRMTMIAIATKLDSIYISLVDDARREKDAQRIAQEQQTLALLAAAKRDTTIHVQGGSAEQVQIDSVNTDGGDFAGGDKHQR